MKRVVLGALAMVAMASAASVANADVIYVLNQYKQDAGQPDGTSPWITATFETAGANTVKLTIDASNLGTGNFIPEFFINSKTAITSASKTSGPLNFTGISAGGTPPGSGVNFSYTLSFQNPNSPAGGRFSGGEIAVLSLVGTGLTEASFDKFVTSTKTNYLNDDLYVAAKIQGVSAPVGSTVIWDGDGGDDDTPRIPEPASLGLLGLGALGLLARRRK